MMEAELAVINKIQERACRELALDLVAIARARFFELKPKNVDISVEAQSLLRDPDLLCLIVEAIAGIQVNDGEARQKIISEALSRRYGYLTQPDGTAQG